MIIQNKRHRRDGFAKWHEFFPRKKIAPSPQASHPEQHTSRRSDSQRMASLNGSLPIVPLTHLHASHPAAVLAPRHNAIPCFTVTCDFQQIQGGQQIRFFITNLLASLILGENRIHKN